MESSCLWRVGLLFNSYLCLPLLLLLLSNTPTAGSDSSPQYWETAYAPPYFDNTTRRQVTVSVGQTALLNCRVRNLGDRAVSWIRRRDLHILTVGILTYTNDQRFQSLHSDGSDEWTLRISSPQTRDSGTYECQVSTEPKISKGFRLQVVVSRAKILGNAELFVKSGSDINLTCMVRPSPAPPSFIYWYKDKRLVNYAQSGRKRVQVLTEQSTRSSRLLITNASPPDTGNYTCSPSSSESASVVVHVINGEHPAAMQHGNSTAHHSLSMGTPRGLALVTLALAVGRSLTGTCWPSCHLVVVTSFIVGFLFMPQMSCLLLFAVAVLGRWKWWTGELDPQRRRRHRATLINR